MLILSMTFIGHSKLDSWPKFYVEKRPECVSAPAAAHGKDRQWDKSEQPVVSVIHFSLEFLA